MEGRKVLWRILTLSGIILVATVAIGFIRVGNTDDQSAGGSNRTLRPTGAAQLVSYEPIPESDSGMLCSYEPASLKYTSLDGALLEQELAADNREKSAAASDSTDTSGSAATSSPTDFPQRKPIRTIHDPYSDFSAVGVDPAHNEVVVTDENLFNILVYDRKGNTPASKITEPIRKVGGLNTDIEFQCGVYVDPKSGDIYAVNNDTEDHLTIFFSRGAGRCSTDPNDPHPARNVRHRGG